MHKDEQTADLGGRELRRFFKQVEGLDSNIVLAFYINGLVGAVNRSSDALVRSIDAQTKDNGKWLGQIATVIAASGSGDLGAIKELAVKLKASTDELEAAVAANQPPPE